MGQGESRARSRRVYDAVEHANMRRGVLRVVVLGALQESPDYAYRLGRRLRAVHELCCPENELYTCLRGLEKRGLLSHTWVVSAVGPPRKYYTLSDEGLVFLRSLRQTWHSLADALVPPPRCGRCGDEITDARGPSKLASRPSSRRPSHQATGKSVSAV